MYKNQTPKHLELRDSKVGGLDGTQALVSVKSNADVSFIYHGHIVSSIADSQSNRIPIVFLDHPNNISLLFGRDSTANYCLTGFADPNKIDFEV